ncbi:MAG TPA: hypothetical protein VL068_09015, partial [Microthrixaceae bacterium]|nr:hypothetical protein [Microthrixaceae bacterium]
LALIVSGSLAGNSAALAQDGDAPPPSAIAPYDSANFLNGEAQSSATTFKFNIVQGNANIGMSYGFSMAGYRDTTGTSESRALDLGIFPTLYGVEQCDGSAPVLNPQTFPPLTIASSTNPDSVTPKPANAYLPGYGTQKAGPFVGSQVATAAKGPSSSAYTDSAKADMVFISIEGGHSESTTSLKDHVREARSVVTAKRLTVMGGLFVFHQPRWEAVARSGKEVSATGSFTFKRATVLGIDRSPEDAMRDLKAFKKGLEDLLKPLGAKLELPAVTVNDNRVTVTPMTFKLTDPPFGAKMISPFLQNIQPLREAYNKAQLDADCKNETSLLMMDVVLGVLSGSGSIEFMAGGTEAWTDDTDFSAPPITPIPAESIVPPAPAVAAVDPIPPTPYSEFIPGEYIPGTDGDLDLADPIDFDTTLPDVGDTELAPPPDVLTKTKVKPKHGREVAAMPASTTIDESKAGTAAVAVGLMGLLGALGLTFGEHFRARRSARRIP